MATRNPIVYIAGVPQEIPSSDTFLAANIPLMTGDTGTGGTAGAVPAPVSGDAAKFFRGDGIYAAALTTTQVATLDSAQTAVIQGLTTTALTAVGSPVSGVVQTLSTTQVTQLSGTLYGTGVGSITSAQLAASVSDETGTGALVFGTSPSISGVLSSISATVTAGTNAQGQAELTSDINTITTTAANPSGVTLPTPGIGARVVINNRGTNPVNIYPSSGGAINALATNTPISLAVGGTMAFSADSATLWQVGSAGGGSDIIVLDEGTTKTSAVTSFDFVGAGVVVTNTGDAVTVTIAGAAADFASTAAIGAWVR